MQMRGKVLINLWGPTAKDKGHVEVGLTHAY